MDSLEFLDGSLEVADSSYYLRDAISIVCGCSESIVITRVRRVGKVQEATITTDNNDLFP